MKVFVYWNLRKRVFSVKALSGPLRGRVVAHQEVVSLPGRCELRVQQGGRERVLATGHKTVHAGIVGQWDPDRWLQPQAEHPVRYNLFKAATFVDERGSPIQLAQDVVCHNGRAFAGVIG